MSEKTIEDLLKEAETIIENNEIEKDKIKSFMEQINILDKELKEKLLNYCGLIIKVCDIPYTIEYKFSHFIVERCGNRITISSKFKWLPTFYNNVMSLFVKGKNKLDYSIILFYCKMDTLHTDFEEFKFNVDNCDLFKNLLDFCIDFKAYAQEQIVLLKEKNDIETESLKNAADQASNKIKNINDIPRIEKDLKNI